MTIEVNVETFHETSLQPNLLDRDAFLTGLLNQFSASEKSGWVQQSKNDAVKWVRHSVIPNTRDEEWRFTDLSPLKKVTFNSVGTIHELSLTDDFVLPEVAHRLVFVNGVFAANLSNTENLPAGLKVGNLDVLGDDVAEKYLAQSEGTRDVFTALNTAGLNDVAVVLVGKNVIVENPIHLLFISVAAEGAIISQPRCLVVAESNSQLSLIEEFITGNGEYLTGKMPVPQEQQVYFNNSVTEIWVNENAQVNHNRIVLESNAAFHIGKTAVTQARYSRYTCNAVTVGGKISRHNLDILQTGEQTETTLNGLTVIADKQLADTHSAISLNHPHGVSKQLHKCIIGDRAHGVFNGKIFVPKPAQLTDAAQLNRNLLLSSKARIDTKPQLEITADNVKCAHGATVSQLEDDEIFYLQSRGIDETDARKLLVNAFAAEIINLIPVSSLREKLIKTVITITNK
ncbi:Fe-S cluster assembly protein SufD [Sphaerospermopsis torques-reginae]|uniref:Fe-S cluster assembly protein SufD n=1 Tax=Sphaerospermopsis torques-reginae ITEP-024 TaxID=984208 RepID=A0ABX8WW92_9CYAN|nr:Fe-S cluster assembly protein SufD [Sphaerospermopsis torques-reginae]QYX30663.1 Fe-S cluster assembly protein SufD [Sphaerospermopsis torques-reginae ITEP-024]